MRLEARVGERPAGAVSGEGTAALAFNRAAGDLGCRMLRGRAEESVLGGLLRTSLKAEEETALVRAKAGGLVKPLCKSFQRSAPLDRFEKSTGAMFSELPPSSTSEALRLMGEVEIALACQLPVTVSSTMRTGRGRRQRKRENSRWQAKELDFQRHGIHC